MYVLPPQDILTVISGEWVIDTMEAEYKCLECAQALCREDIVRVFGGYACRKCGGKITLYNAA